MIPKRLELSNCGVQFPQENQGLSKRNFLKIAAFASLGMVPFLKACSLFDSRNSNHGQEKKMDNTSKHGSMSRSARPPIDLDVPTKVETATFALG
jgi:hypothetical protein